MAKKLHGIWSEFKKFITRGNVVDMAVGVTVATAFTAIVTAFTKGFIAPLVALLSNNASLSDFKWIIRPEVLDEAGEVVTSEIAILWGAFVQAVIDFLIIAAVMFCILKIFVAASAKAEKLRTQMEDKVTGRDREAEAKAAEEKAAAEKAAAEAKAAEEAALKAAVLRQTELLEKLCEIESKK